MLRPVVLIATLLTTCPAVALKPLPPPPQPRPVLVVAPQASMPIRVQKLSIRSEISGSMAETTVRLVLYNPNHRPLEGTLQFPLEDGQQISAFALDIDGALRPAVPVEKAKGREVFEAIQRRRVDPGLLEVTQGNNFKLRIFPINGGATRTAEIRYAEPLRRHGGQLHYRLPLGYGKVDNFDLALKINGRDAAPQVRGLRGLPELRFEPVEGGYRAAFSQHGFDPSGTLEIALGMTQAPRSYRQQLNGENYFIAEVPVDSQPARRAAPRVIGLLWDSSGSGAKRDREAELAVLEHYLRALGNVEVRLTRLRDRAERTLVFPVQGGDWRALRRELEATVYDGATTLGDWQSDAGVDEYLLFSDGLHNYGAARMPVLGSRQRLYALDAASAADSTRLAAIAVANGGEHIAIDSQAPGQAADQLLFDDARVIDVQARGGADVVFASRTVRNGMLRLAGRLLQPGQLTLTLASGGRTRQVTVPLPADMPAHPLAAHTWANLRLRQLEADPEAHRGEIGRLGKKFSIPTRETSLIVLEQLQDYVTFGIAPPPQLAPAVEELRASWQAALAQDRSKQLDEVVQLYAQRIDWWRRDFPKTAPVSPKRPAPVLARPGVNKARTGPVEVMLIAPPAPAMAPEVAVMQPPPPPAAAPAVSARAAAPAAGPRERAEAPTRSGQIGIGLARWNPNAPYIARLRDASPAQVYAIYLDEKPSYDNSTAFFLDAADVLFEKGQRELGLRVLSNLAEMDLENRAILRILGYRLLQAGAPGLAVPVFEQVVRIGQEEPQSWRDLGLAYAAAGQAQQAIDKLYEVAVRPWDGRFPDIETIALAEMNAIIARSRQTLDTRRIDPRLLKNLPLDLRVVMTWDADNTDMDLHVTDPVGDTASYARPLTRQGGRMSRDFTGGYGPEEFALRTAMPGKYRIHAQYYGNSQQVLAGATTLQLNLVTGFGTGAQKDNALTLRLKDQGERVFVGEFEVTASGVR